MNAVVPQYRLIDGGENSGNYFFCKLCVWPHTCGEQRVFDRTPHSRERTNCLAKAMADRMLDGSASPRPAIL
jgi:hypothetical protein